MNHYPSLKTFQNLFQKRADPDEFDPALLTAQNWALDKVKKARDEGDEEQIANAVRVAKETGALLS